MEKPPFSVVTTRPGFSGVDIGIILFLFTILYLVIYIASGWEGSIGPININLSPIHLPYYALNSIFRIFVAYSLSFIFAIWYGYTANKSKLHEKIMIPLLDILQAIPVLSFLPGVTLAMIALFPGRRFGLELSSILLIFTGQVWNMAFSYYNSINTIPRELKEVTIVYKFSRIQKFFKLDLPFSAIGLVWNSMMSVAGGWFFLMACEMFVLEDKDFRLPGLGAYIHTAADRGDVLHVLYGLATMIFIIVFLDIFIWRPLVAWTQKFKLGAVMAEEERDSVVLQFLRKSKIIEKATTMVVEFIDYLDTVRFKKPAINTALLKRLIQISVGSLLLWALIQAFIYLSGLSFHEIMLLARGALFSLLRTSAAIIMAALWTVPAGVAIGMNVKASRIFQPIVQIVASIPATALFPAIIMILIKIGGGLDIGAVFLMLLGTQWYILFNVIAGASAIPRELKEATEIYGLKGLWKWRVLILPGIFPYLITGLITATGGAWNATIVSEYVTFAGKTMSTPGLGAIISAATATGNFRLVLASTILMALMVVSINRLLWKRLFILAQEKYRLE